VQLVLSHLQVILHGTNETIKQTQLDKERTLIHLLQLHMKHIFTYKLHYNVMQYHDIKMIKVSCLYFQVFYIKVTINL